MFYSMPEGYRYATADEVESVLNGTLTEYVQIIVGGTEDEPWTDIAVKDN